MPRQLTPDRPPHRPPADGVDDTDSIQKAINFCKKTQRGLFFPSGTYVVTSALDFGAWQGILVTGGTPGGAGISTSGATVQLQANLNTTQGACFDFSGSAFGSVSGIAFGGNNCQVTVLNARTCCQNKQDENRRWNLLAVTVRPRQQY